MDDQCHASDNDTDSDSNERNTNTAETPDHIEPTSSSSNNLDPADWIIKNSDDRCSIVRTGPIRPKLEKYPVSADGRSFANSHYQKRLNNDERCDRRWLVYSQKLDTVFCFACRLFDNACPSALGSKEGYRDWKHLSERLKQHELSQNHLKSMQIWLEMEKALKLNKTIDREQQIELLKKVNYWKEVLRRLTAITKYLATHNLAFRGHREDQDSDQRGNFIDLCFLLAEFDPVMKEHMTFFTEHAKTHYLSHEFQNEIIVEMAKLVKKAIREKVKSAKYFAILADCTRDIASIEQFSIVLRYVDLESGDIEEHFIDFIPVEKTTAEKLTEAILKEIQDMDLSIMDCRGQGYDNGANMKGEKSGVQTRILQLNPLAFFMPCNCHSLNLVVSDAASACTIAKSFFGLVQRLYTIFSASSMRWSIIQKHVKISLKNLSETRWEARIESVKAIRFQLPEILNALDELKNMGDPMLFSECNSISEEIKSFEFLVPLFIWYDILFQINIVSKIWQQENADLGLAAKYVEEFTSWIANFKEEGIEKHITEVTKLANDLKIPTPTLNETRSRKKKKQFDYESEDQPLTGVQKFKVEFFNEVMNMITSSLDQRFEGLKVFWETFGFLCEMREMSEEDLQKHCSDLQIALSIGDKCDVEAYDLVQELIMFGPMMRKEFEKKRKEEEEFEKQKKKGSEKLKKKKVEKKESSVNFVLKYIIKNDLTDVFPNIFVVMRIICTIPITEAACERSFSVLKLIKNYLRTTMSQERLSALATLSIEKNFVKNLDYSSVIKELSEKKARKKF